MSENDRKKLETLLNYWIEHNKEHGEEFKEWAGKAREFGEIGVHDDLLIAARYMDDANESLIQASAMLKKQESI